MNWHEELIRAIENRQVLVFMYGGQERVVEPHAYGESTAGNRVLRCYQIAGGSNSEKVPDWKLMVTAEIGGLRPTGQTFANARPGYKRGDSAMRHIYAQL